MNSARITKALLIATSAILILNTLMLSRDYQDSWILEGLEIPFLLFVAAFAVAFFSEKRTPLLVILAIVGRVIFLLIPNLKYAWFQGVYFDQFTQYVLANHVLIEGHISPIGSSAYTTTPLFHILISAFSIILNISVKDSMKYLPVMFSSIYPLLTFIFVRKMFPKNKTILKYALFISSIPFTFEQFVVTGSLFGLLLAFLVLFSLTILLQKKGRICWIVFAVFVFSLAASHSVTSTILTALIFSVIVLHKLEYFQLMYPPSALIAFTITSISTFWLMFPAHPVMGTIFRTIFSAVRGGRTPASESLPPTFFALMNTDFLAGLLSFLVFYGADFFFLLLALVGLVILLKNRKKSNYITHFILLFGGLTFSLILIGIFLRLGATRSLGLQRLLYPIFCSVPLLHIASGKSLIRSIIPVIFSLMLFLATVELYGCQPLIPSANILYKDLDPSVPLGYLNMVNSIYQRQVVEHARHHVAGLVASDVHTRNQMFGLAGYAFSVMHLISYYPLDPNQPEQIYDLFVIHTPGRSGTLGEKAEFRTPSLIFGFIYSSNIVYTNGESYMLVHDHNPP